MDLAEGRERAFKRGKENERPNVIIVMTIKENKHGGIPYFMGFRRVLERAIDGTRTRDLHLGKVAYYQLYYYRMQQTEVTT